MLLAQPITRLLFERGDFRPEDTIRVARVIVFYAAGVWANCAWPVVVRGFLCSERLCRTRCASPPGWSA